MSEQHAALAVKPELKDRSLPMLARLCRAGVFSKLELLQSGRLTIIDEVETRHFGPATAQLNAVIRVQDPSFYTDIISGGNIGVAESYMEGKWECSDIYALFRIFARDTEALAGIDGGLAGLMAPALASLEWFRRNNKTGSKKNILAHYDLGNEFYEMMLDPTMNYSCAMFSSNARDLESASIAKLDHVCQKLDLRSTDHLLEIGTGWGGLAMHAAKHYGCKVTTTTISDAQFAYAKSQIEAAGLQDQIELVAKDYRDLEGKYDKIVSIEMIEAVGHQYYQTYFDALNRLLKDDGQILIQAIIINDDRYAEHVRSVDFIQKYIFPGSTIPSISKLLEAATGCDDMRLYNLEDITRSYGPTLLAWRDNFLSHLHEIRELGFSEAFIRMWDFYLSYCAAGFQERYLGNVQLHFCRQKAQPLPLQVNTEFSA